MGGEQRAEFLKGADISFWDEIISEGGAYYENGVQADLLELLKRSGINSVRLRLWNEPAGGYCNLERTLAVAKRVKDAGLHLLLDLHYSDGWADPQKQTKPGAWQHLSFTELADAVRQFTGQVIAALKAQGTLPEMVQIGNEITPGLLWNDGRVDGEWDTYSQWSKMGHLLKSGIKGLREALTEKDDVRIMLHLDRGADNRACQYFLDRMMQLGVDYDVIGLSYYPWWHGTLQQVSDNLADLAVRYGKDLVIVETAYPWTLSADGRALEFIVNKEEQLHDGYPATVDGQAEFLSTLLERVAQVPNGKGIGVYYWEPGWIPAKAVWSVGHDNHWSNLAQFDFNGDRLKSLDIWRRKLCEDGNR